MDRFFILLETLLMLFLYTAVGVLCAKTKIISKANKQSYINFILNITMPAMIFSSYDLDITEELVISAVTVTFLSLLVYSFSFIISRIAYRKLPANQRAILKYATVINNASFIGLPLIGSIYGAQGVLLASCFLIPGRVFMWTVGVSEFTKTDFKTKMKNILINPVIIATAIGVVRMLTQFELPHLLDTAIKGVGACNGFMAMLMVGVILSEVDIKTLWDKTLFYYAFIRLALLPLLLLLIMRMTTLSVDLRGICVILTAMPAGTTTSILAAKFGGDDVYASKVMFVSSVLSLVTVPLMTLIT